MNWSDFDFHDELECNMHMTSVRATRRADDRVTSKRS